MRRVVRGCTSAFGLLAVLVLGACGEHVATEATWQPGGTYAVAGWEPHSVAAGDFDGDHMPDLVVADAKDGRVYFLKGLRRGQFVSHPAVPILGPAGERLVRAGDLDGDDRLDLVLVELSTGAVRSYFGDGGGGFVEAAPAPPLDAAVAGLRGVQTASVDDDGLTDLVALDELGQVLVFRGNGDGSFTSLGGAAPLPPDGVLEAALGLEHALPADLRDAAALDLTGDGLTDLVVTAPDAGEVRVLLAERR